jgi:hypothetical protein
MLTGTARAGPTSREVRPRKRGGRVLLTGARQLKHFGEDKRGREAIKKRKRRD